MLIKAKQEISQDSIHNNAKELSKFYKKKSAVTQDDNILSRVCCPNCRYLFKVVNQNKLLGVKKKMQILDPILQEKTQIAKEQDKIQDKIQVVNKNASNLVTPFQTQQKKPKIPQTPNKKTKSSLKTQSQQKLAVSNAKISQNQKTDQSIINQAMIQNSQSINKKKQERNQENCPQQFIEDIYNLKRYLYHSGEKQEFQIKVNNIASNKVNNMGGLNQDDQAFPPSSSHQNTTLQNIFDSLSSITRPKKMIQFQRSCTTCQKMSFKIKIDPKLDINGNQISRQKFLYTQLYQMFGTCTLIVLIIFLLFIYLCDIEYFCISQGGSYFGRISWDILFLVIFILMTGEKLFMRIERYC